MKNYILLVLFLIFSSTVVLAQKEVNEYITMVEKDTLYWQYSDTACLLVLHKLDNTQETMIVFRQSKPSDKIKDIKFEKNVCGIFFESFYGHSYMFLTCENKTWKVIKVYNWLDNMISPDLSDMLSISLDTPTQLSVAKKDNTTDIISFDNDGKVTITKKK